MVEPSAVTDTHALIFHAAGGGRLGPGARTHFEAAERRKALVYVPDLYSHPAYQPYDLGADQVVEADELRFTRDPFDGRIVAAARGLRLPLLTRDTAIRESGLVAVIW